MNIELIPTLGAQRELYASPRNMARFCAYIDAMTGPSEGGKTDIVLPIGMINPMGREHCLHAIEALMALDAEAIVARALAGADERLSAFDGNAKVCLNLLDDVAGGWTNRYLTETRLRLGSGQMLRANKKRRIVTVPCWASETYTPALVRQETLAALYRHAYRDRFGIPEILRDQLRWEGLALLFAGVHTSAPSHILAPRLPLEDLEYTGAVVEPYLETPGLPVQFACFFGDDAAVEVGYKALGLPPRAGFAIALADAHASDESPEQALREAVQR